MRIALFQAYLGRHENLAYPLGLSYIAAVAKQQSSVELSCIDLNTVAEPYKTLEEQIHDFDPDLIGFSLRNIDTTQSRDLFYYYHSFQQQIARVKQLKPHTPLVVGGSGFSLYAERIMKDNPFIDIGVYLEGEETFNNLIKHLDNPETVKGLFMRKNQSVFFTGHQDKMDLSAIPPLEWDIFTLDKYKPIHNAIGVETKRGCALKCEYCTYPFLDGMAVRKHDTAKIIDSIEKLYSLHGIENFTFVDSIFNVPNDHAASICDQIIDRKIPVKWVAWFNEKNLNKDFMKLCKKAGCIEFSFSPDGFSDSALRKLGKNISKKDIIRVYSIAKEVKDLGISYNFVANPPGQDFFTFFKLFFFLIKTKFMFRKRLKGFCVTNLRIEPNTGIYGRALSEKIITDDTDLLPSRTKDLKLLFYSNPDTWYLDYFMKIYIALWTIRNWIKKSFL